MALFPVIAPLQQPSLQHFPTWCCFEEVSASRTSISNIVRILRNLKNVVLKYPVLRIRDVYPGSDFSIPDPRSKRFRISDQDLHQRILVFLIRYKKNQSKLSDKWSGMFILDPDTGVKKAPDPQDWKYWYCTVCCRTLVFRIQIKIPPPPLLAVEKDESWL